MRLKDRVAIVTGAGSTGIGRAICERFAEEGAAVAAWDVNGSGAAETAEIVRAKGGRAVGMKVDVSDEDDVRSAVAEVVDAFGKIDVLVNNAGVMHNATVESDTPEAWDRLISINLKGIFLCTRHVVPHMRGRAGCAIINTGSVTGIMGYPNLAAYSASKGAVHSLTRSLAMDYAPEGIRVNAIAPGTVDTPILHDFLARTPDPEKARAAFVAIHPLGRLATPRDIANAALFLASDESSFVTGHTLVVDGGFTIAGSQPTG